MWTWLQRSNGSLVATRGDGKQTGQMIDPQGSSGMKYVDVVIPAAQVLTLNATPRTLVPAPPAGMAHIFEGIVVHKPAGTAYAGIAVGEDLAVKYTDGAGIELTEVETTGFLDSAGAQTRFARAFAAATLINSITPVAAAAIVLHMLAGEITTGNSPLNCRVYFRTIPTVLPSTL